MSIRDRITEKLIRRLRDEISDYVFNAGLDERTIMGLLKPSIEDFDKELIDITYNYVKYLIWLKNKGQDSSNAFENYIQKVEKAKAKESTGRSYDEELSREMLKQRNDERKKYEELSEKLHRQLMNNITAQNSINNEPVREFDNDDEEDTLSQVTFIDSDGNEQTVNFVEVDPTVTNINENIFRDNQNEDDEDETDIDEIEKTLAEIMEAATSDYDDEELNENKTLLDVMEETAHQLGIIETEELTGYEDDEDSDTIINLTDQFLDNDDYEVDLTLSFEDKEELFKDSITSFDIEDKDEDFEELEELDEEELDNENSSFALNDLLIKELNSNKENIEVTKQTVDEILYLLRNKPSANDHEQLLNNQLEIKRMLNEYKTIDLVLKQDELKTEVVELKSVINDMNDIISTLIEQNMQLNEKVNNMFNIAICPAKPENDDNSLVDIEVVQFNNSYLEQVKNDSSLVDAWHTNELKKVEPKEHVLYTAPTDPIIQKYEVEQYQDKYNNVDIAKHSIEQWDDNESKPWILNDSNKAQTLKLEEPSNEVKNDNTPEEYQGLYGNTNAQIIENEVKESRPWILNDDQTIINTNASSANSNELKKVEPKEHVIYKPDENIDINQYKIESYEDPAFSFNEPIREWNDEDDSMEKTVYHAQGIEDIELGEEVKYKGKTYTITGAEIVENKDWSQSIMIQLEDQDTDDVIKVSTKDVDYNI